MKDVTDFIKWLDTIEGMSQPEILDWSNYRAQNTLQIKIRGQQDIDEILRQKFLEETLKLLGKNEKRYLYFSGWAAPLELIGREPSVSFHYGLDFSSNTPLRLSKLSFKILDVHGPSVELTDIWVDTLKLDHCMDVTLVNCFIGTLKLNETAAETLAMRGGAVLDIECWAPSGKVPFTGSVYFDKKVDFPRVPGRRLKGPQPYRNMRAHMLKLENIPMVSRFHSLEQAMEKEMEDSRFNRAISLVYSYLSDYGSSALRPFLWFVSIFIITFSASLFDGVGHAEVENLNGWQESLAGDDYCPRALRAFVLTWQATLNPLGIFGIKGLLFAQTGVLAFWLPFHGLLSAIFIALFIFAIRRRFKMS